LFRSLEVRKFMVPCKKCGAPNDPNASFCRGCGTAQPSASAGTAPAVVPPPPASAVAYPPAPPATKKKSKKALKIVGIVVAVFIALVIWGAIIDSGKNGGKGPATPESSESKPAVAPAPASEEEQGKDGRLMCAEIQPQLKDSLKNAIKGIECKPGGETGGIALVIAYPLPLLAKDDLVRK